VVVAASVALAGAAVVRGAELFRGRDANTAAPRRAWRPTLSILALVAAGLFVFVYCQVLLATEQDNWPPPPMR
jgi:hypothetical protein